MSLWTPEGEHPVGREPAPSAEPTGPAPPGEPAAPEAPEGEPSMADLQPEEQERVRALQAELAAARERLLEAPAEVVVVNHAMGLYELAALHLSVESPRLPDAVLAIDALAALVEGLQGRLGEAEPTLVEALRQLRVSYLQARERPGGGA